MSLLEYIRRDGSINSCRSEKSFFTDITILALVFLKSKRELASLFEIFTNIEFVESDEITSYPKKRKKTNNKKKKKTATYSNQLVLVLKAAE